MSKRNKLEKFEQLSSFPNTYQNYDAKTPELTNHEQQIVDLKGKWQSDHFKNDLPIVLELACGRGEYSLGLARMFPEKNFIGLDIKGARIWQGAKIALEENLDNVAFLRTKIEMIQNFFSNNEISEIWITFPDPFLRKSKANRRLTSWHFLKKYSELLIPGGLVHLKTDSTELYEFTLEVLNETDHTNLIYHSSDIYADQLYTSELELKTYYEKMHLANKKKIKYVRFTVN